MNFKMLSRFLVYLKITKFIEGFKDNKSLQIHSLSLSLSFFEAEFLCVLALAVLDLAL